MELASLANVQKRVIQILNANPTAFATTVGGGVGAFPYSDEIDLAILETDEQICNYGYFASANGSLANPFDVTSAPLADEDPVPFHHGNLTRVDVTQTYFSLANTNFNAGSDAINIPSHGLTTGQTVSFVLVSGTMPSGVAVLTTYYVIAIDINTIKLATTLSRALAGVVVDITSAATAAVIQMLVWVVGVEAAKRDDITNATAVGNAYVGANSFNFLYKVDDGQIYTSATWARVVYPEYTRTSALQIRQSEEYLCICGAISMLTKNASPAPFEYYANEFQRGMQQLVTDGYYKAQVEAAA